MWLNTPASTVIEFSVFYTQGHKGRHTDRGMDTQTDGQTGWFKYTPKTCVLQGYKYILWITIEATEGNYDNNNTKVMAVP